MRRWPGLLALVGAFVFSTLAWAQTAAPLPVQPGTLTTSGCPSVNLTPCFLPQSLATPLAVAPAPYATGQTAIAVSSGNVGAAIATATLPAVAAKTNYVSTIAITGAGATGASVVACTLSGTANTLTFIVAVPASATTGVSPVIQAFAPPLPASAVNTGLVLSCPSFGAGNTNAAVSISGFYQ